MECFYLVDNQVLHWNRVCTSLPFKRILKYLSVLCVVYCLKAISRSIPLGCVKETKYTVRSEGVLSGAENNRINEVGQAYEHLLEKSVTSIDCTRL